MIIPSRILNRYSNSEPYIRAAGDKVKETLFNFCGEHGFAFLARMKAVESIAEKIETGRYQKWSDIDDLFACTIITPTLLEENKVIEFLESTFKKVQLRKRGDSLKPPDAFRFDSTRFIGYLRSPEDLEPPLPIYNVLFEVQIKSAFEHAWSVTTHALTYKASVIDWRLLRLTAQLKAAVEQLDSLIIGFRESAKNIQEQRWPEVEAKKKIAEFFKSKVDVASIPDEMTPKDWSRFSENVYSLLRSSRTFQRNRIEQTVDEMLDNVEAFLRSGSSELMPRSISLLQMVVGILTDAKMLTPPLNNYHVLITPELESLYPSVRVFKTYFRYDE